MRIFRNITATIALSVAALVSSGTPALAVSPPEEICGAWESPTYFQTSFTYGRVSHRPCVVHTATLVKARTEFRLDWPGVCSVGDGIGCDPRFFTKQEKLAFDDLDVRVWWELPNGVRGYNESYPVGDDETLDEGTWGGEHIRVSESPWLERIPGSYSVTSQVRVNIDNDGAGKTALNKSQPLVAEL